MSLSAYLCVAICFAVFSLTLRVQALQHRNAEKGTAVPDVPASDPRINGAYNSFWTQFCPIDCVRLRGLDNRVVNLHNLPTTHRRCSILETACTADSAADLNVRSRRGKQTGFSQGH